MQNEDKQWLKDQLKAFAIALVAVPFLLLLANLLIGLD